MDIKKLEEAALILFPEDPEYDDDKQRAIDMNREEREEWISEQWLTYHKNLAYESTFNRGINPEGVEKMREYAELEEEYSKTGMILVGNDKLGGTWARLKLDELRKEALTAAKL